MTFKRGALALIAMIAVGTTPALAQMSSGNSMSSGSMTSDMKPEGTMHKTMVHQKTTMHATHRTMHHRKPMKHKVMVKKMTTSTTTTPQ